MRIHHIGYLVKDISISIQKFIQLGYIEESQREYDKDRDIFVQFIVNDLYRIELVQPASADSEYYSAMRRFKNLPYHICYETGDIYRTIEDLRNNGFRLSQEPREAPCIRNQRVAFMQNPEIGIIELIEIQEHRN